MGWMAPCRRSHRQSASCGIPLSPAKTGCQLGANAIVVRFVDGVGSSPSVARPLGVAAWTGPQAGSTVLRLHRDGRTPRQPRTRIRAGSAARLLALGLGGVRAVALVAVPSGERTASCSWRAADAVRDLGRSGLPLRPVARRRRRRSVAATAPRARAQVREGQPRRRRRGGAAGSGRAGPRRALPAGPRRADCARCSSAGVAAVRVPALLCQRPTRASVRLSPAVARMQLLRPGMVA